jgi:zinc protease
VLLVSLPLAATAQSPEPWTKIPIPPLHAFKPTEPKRIELPNGLVIFLQEDHELPFISGTVLIRGGSRDEPANKIGLVSLYGDTWRTSGTATADGDLLDDRLEAKAATIETGGGMALTTMSWSSLKGDFDSVFASAVDLLLHPAFKADKLNLARMQMEAGISRRNDDASGIAARQAAILVYGAKSPYAREPQYANPSPSSRPSSPAPGPASTPSTRRTSISRTSSSSASAPSAATPTSTPSA